NGRWRGNIAKGLPCLLIPDERGELGKRRQGRRHRKHHRTDETDDASDAPLAALGHLARDGAAEADADQRNRPMLPCHLSELTLERFQRRLRGSKVRSAIPGLGIESLTRQKLAQARRRKIR